MNLIILAVLFPMIMGIVIHQSKNIYPLVLITSIVEQIIVVLAVIYANNITVFTFTDDLVLKFGLDGISKIYLLILSITFGCVSIFSIQYMKKEEDQKRYYFFHFLVYGVLMGLASSQNYFSMYLFYELMTFSSYPLVIHDKNDESMSAGMKYLGYSVFGAGLGLIGLFFVSYYGSTEFIYGGVISADAPRNIMLAIYLVSMIGFSVKSGMFPLHAWLPTAHPVAPATASSVLSGCITKMGILAMIRITYYIYGIDYLKGTYPIKVILVLAMITVFMGSMLAYNCKHTKKRLAYSTVSQVSYIIIALMTLNKWAIVAAMLHVVYHMFSKNVLFLVSGTVIQATSSKEISAFDGLAKKMPVVMASFVIASLALVGLPVTGGFVSKWFIATNVLSSGSPYALLSVIILMISALLTAGYLLVPATNAYFKDLGHESLSPTLYEKIPLMIFSVLIVFLAFNPEIIIDLVLSSVGG